MLRENALQSVTDNHALRIYTPEPKAHMVPTKPEWWDDELRDNYEGRCRQVVKAFIDGDLPAGTSMKHTNMNGRHTYSTKKNGTELWMFKNNPSIKVRICIAKKVGGLFVGNASSLFFARSPATKNNPRPKVKATSGSQLKIQQVLSQAMPMVPFGLFKETMLDLDTLQIIDKGPDEQLELGRKEKGKEVLTHYTGSLVFKIDFMQRSKLLRDHTGEGQHFLFDIDRNDLRLKNLNFFLSRLPRPVTSLQDAYASLKPKEVYEAERFLGREVQRQGEWFFVPVPGRFRRKVDAFRWNGAKRVGRHPFVEACLQSKGNRPHYVKFLSEEGYVTGLVRHGGHEHKPIELKGWHKPIPNMAVESFKISGAVD
jgi:hypothetical protein